MKFKKKKEITVKKTNLLYYTVFLFSVTKLSQITMKSIQALNGYYVVAFNLDSSFGKLYLLKRIQMLKIRVNARDLLKYMNI